MTIGREFLVGVAVVLVGAVVVSIFGSLRDDGWLIRFFGGVTQPQLDEALTHRQVPDLQRRIDVIERRLAQHPDVALSSPEDVVRFIAENDPQHLREIVREELQALGIGDSEVTDSMAGLSVRSPSDVIVAPTTEDKESQQVKEIQIVDGIQVSLRKCFWTSFRLRCSFFLDNTTDKRELVRAHFQRNANTGFRVFPENNLQYFATSATIANITPGKSSVEYNLEPGLRADLFYMIDNVPLEVRLIKLISIDLTIGRYRRNLTFKEIVIESR